MLAQSADAQALEKTVIAGYNSKLAARAQSFAASNSGVCYADILDKMMYC